MRAHVKHQYSSRHRVRATHGKDSDRVSGVKYVQIYRRNSECSKNQQIYSGLISEL